MMHADFQATTSVLYVRYANGSGGHQHVGMAGLVTGSVHTHPITLPSFKRAAVFRPIPWAFPAEEGDTRHVIERLGLGTGAEVRIGMLGPIPSIVEVLKPGKVAPAPTNCPTCNCGLNVHFLCLHPYCRQRIVAICKQWLDLVIGARGVGYTWLYRWLDQGRIRGPADLYRMENRWFLEEESFFRAPSRWKSDMSQSWKLARKAKAREVTLPTLLKALRIPMMTTPPFGGTRVTAIRRRLLAQIEEVDDILADDIGERAQLDEEQVVAMQAMIRCRMVKDLLAEITIVPAIRTD